MNQADRLERDLTAWFADTAAPSRPDYTDDIVRETGRMRQRARWTFPERWLPVSETTLRRLTPPALPWRTAGLLALLIVLLVAALAFYAGSRPKVPLPFGPAANGSVAYAKDGDIWTVQPASGSRSPVVTGPELDADPRWSLDGTRLAFLRYDEGKFLAAFVNAEGGNLVVAKDGPVRDVDSESIAWSQDGRTISFSSADGAVWIVDAETGEAKTLDRKLGAGEVFWRPPDGEQLLFQVSPTALTLVTVADLSAEELSLPAGVTVDRASGWTPDGRRFAFMGQAVGADASVTFIMDAETGEKLAELPVSYAQISNAGDRVVGLNGDGPNTWICVAPIDGGPCRAITDKIPGAWGTFYRWSPDDQWILVVRRGEDDLPFVLDPEGPVPNQPWTSEGVESWQRLAP